MIPINSIAEFLWSLKASVMPKLIPYLFLPFMLSRIGEAGMGYLGASYSIITIMSLIVGFQSFNYLNKFWATFKVEERTVAISNILTGCIIICLVFAVFFLPIKSLFTILNHFTFIHWFAILITSLWLSIYSILSVVYQFRGEHKKIAMFSSSYVIFHYFFGCLALVFFTSSNWEIMIYIQSLVAAFLSIIAIKKLIGPMKYKIKKNVINEIISFSWPLVIHSIGLAMITSFDKIFLLAKLGAAQTGYYFVASMIGMSLNLIHEAALRLWNPYFYRTIKENEKTERIKKYIHYYSLSSIFFFLIFVSLVWIGNSYINFFDKKQVLIIIIVALAYSVESVRKLYAGFFIVDKRSLFLAFHTITGTIVMLFFNFFFFESLGVLTPAFAMLAGFTSIMFIKLCTVRSLTSYNAR